MAPTKACFEIDLGIQRKRKHVSDSPQKVNKKGKQRQIESSSEDEWDDLDEGSDEDDWVDDTPNTSLESAAPRTRSKAAAETSESDPEEPVASEPSTPKPKAKKSKAVKVKSPKTKATKPKAKTSKAKNPTGKSGRGYGLMSTEWQVYWGRTGIQALVELEQKRAIRCKERRAELRFRRKLELVRIDRIDKQKALADQQLEMQRLQAEMFANTSESERMRQYDEKIAQLQRECDAFNHANSKLVRDAEKSKHAHEIEVKAKDESIAKLNLESKRHAIDLKALELKIKEMELSMKLSSLGD